MCPRAFSWELPRPVLKAKPVLLSSTHTPHTHSHIIFPATPPVTNSMEALGENHVEELMFKQCLEGRMRVTLGRMQEEALAMTERIGLQK